MDSDITYFKYAIAVPSVKILDDPPGGSPSDEPTTSSDALFPPHDQSPDGRAAAATTTPTLGIEIKKGKVDAHRCAFQLRWYVSDMLKGASPFVYHVNRDDDGEEIRFNYHSEFQLEASNGVVAHLLQLSLVACTPQDAECIERGDASVAAQSSSKNSIKVLGVLMIDLNAHVPRKPAQVSSQKATLYMARSPLTPAPLMRIAIQGKPAADKNISSPPPPPPGSPSPIVSAARNNNNNKSGAMIDNNSSDLRSNNSITISASVPRGTSPAPGGGGGGDDVLSPKIASSTSPNNAIVEELLDQATPMNPKDLANAFETSKKQLRQLLLQNDYQRREIMTLQRRNRIQQEEMKKVRDSASESGVTRIRAAYEAKISELRWEISDLKSSNEDLKSMAQSAEILAESLTRELEAAKYEAKEGCSIAQGSQVQLEEALEQHHRYERAIKHGQEEIVKLHSYCAQAKSAFEDAITALNKERLENEHYKQRCADLQRLLDAAKLIKQKENQYNLPLR